jgi:hypothetical protein
VFDPGATASDEPLRPGWYRHVGTIAWWTSTLRFVDAPGRYGFRAEHVMHTWVPADWRDEWLLDRRTTGRRVWLLGDEAQAISAGLSVESRWPTGRWRAPYGDFYAASAGRRPGPHDGDWSVPTPEFLAGLPVDPQALYDRMRADSRADRRGDSGVIVLALRLLRTGLVPAERRAAVYRALLLLPGVTIDKAAHNVAGRAVVALAYDDSRRRHEVLVDPIDGQFAGERSTVTGVPEGGSARDWYPTGTLLASTAVRVAVVPGLGVMPAE